MKEIKIISLLINKRFQPLACLQGLLVVDTHQIEFEFGMHWFLREGKPGTGIKTLGAGTRTYSKLNPATQGVNPGIKP